MLPAIVEESENGSTPCSWQKYKLMRDLVAGSCNPEVLDHLLDIMNNVRSLLVRIRGGLRPKSGDPVVGVDPSAVMWVKSIVDVRDIVDSVEGSLKCVMGPGGKFLDNKRRVRTLREDSLPLTINALLKSCVVYHALILDGKSKNDVGADVIACVESVVSALSCVAHTVQVMTLEGEKKQEHVDVDYLSAATKTAHIVSESLSQLVSLVVPSLVDRIQGCIMLISDVSSLLSHGSREEWEEWEDVKYCYSVAMSSAGTLCGSIKDDDISHKGYGPLVQALKNIVNHAVSVNSYISRRNAQERQTVRTAGSAAVRGSGLDVLLPGAAEAISAAGSSRIRDRVYGTLSKVSGTDGVQVSAEEKCDEKKSIPGLLSATKTKCENKMEGAAQKVSEEETEVGPSTVIQSPRIPRGSSVKVGSPARVAAGV